MQFLNDDFIYQGKQICPNLPGPLWKMNCPLLLNHERTVIIYIILESRADFTRYTQTWLLPDRLNQEIT